MTVTNPSIQVQSDSQTAASAASTRTARNTLDQQAFLQILVAKLQNQDPMSPMEDQDFIAQMAQFSALEQMQSLNAGFGFAQAAALVGRHVQAVLPSEAGGVEVVTGPVTRALTRSGVPMLVVDGREVPYDNSLVIYDPDQGGTPAPDPGETV